MAPEFLSAFSFKYWLALRFKEAIYPETEVPLKSENDYTSGAQGQFPFKFQSFSVNLEK